jgi:uncharacterized ubiquitin-like protein YukD
MSNISIKIGSKCVDLHVPETIGLQRLLYELGQAYPNFEFGERSVCKVNEKAIYLAEIDRLGEHLITNGDKIEIGEE